ncbi:DUF6226 family protein [Rhodococcus sp. RCBS9]|uniref:DUF6226 family protein n=1 Tax=Rhodococcus TaxID=1827 RepID=UPI002402C3E4|nr:DUF6226 family protein [Rhodococcus sp. RCBS9]WCT05624.1 DUF6226 family protein [Rhodococcus qingshengii]WEX06754.1 DUF6226 family protein [Rhodococcus sp. RCBS9]
MCGGRSVPRNPAGPTPFWNLRVTCDGCDRGSAVLLEEFDTWVLSVVDGSLAVDVTAPVIRSDGTLARA